MPDSARRPRHRCPFALQSWQPFAPVPRRLAGFVASPSKTALQAVRRAAHVRARLKRAVRFASRPRPVCNAISASRPAIRQPFDRGATYPATVCQLPPSNAATYPATSNAANVRRPSAFRRGDRGEHRPPRRIRRHRVPVYPASRGEHRTRQPCATVRQSIRQRRATVRPCASRHHRTRRPFDRGEHRNAGNVRATIGTRATVRRIRRQPIRHHRTRQPFAPIQSGATSNAAPVYPATVRPFRPVSGSTVPQPIRQAAATVGKDSGQCRRIPPAVRSTVGRLPCYRGNRSTLARLNRAENGLASRPHVRPCPPRPSETRRALCKPSAPCLQRNQRQASRRKRARIPATVANIERRDRSTVAQPIRRPCASRHHRPRRRIRRNIERGKPWRTRRNRSGLSVYPASRGGSTCAACQRFGSPRRIPPRPCAGFQQRRDRAPVATIERAASSGKRPPWQSGNAAPIPAHVAGYCPPSAPPLPVRLAIAATVRPSPA